MSSWKKRRTVSQRVLPRCPVQQLHKGYPVLAFSWRCRNHIPVSLSNSSNAVSVTTGWPCPSTTVDSVWSEVVQVSLERSPRWPHTREVSMRSSTDRQMKENGVRGIGNSRTPSNSSTGRPAKRVLSDNAAFPATPFGGALRAMHVGPRDRLPTRKSPHRTLSGWIRQTRPPVRHMIYKCKSLAAFNRFRSRIPVLARLPTRNFARDFRSPRIIGYTVAAYV